jgi:hypothetical protein
MPMDTSRDVKFCLEICSVLGYYAASSGNALSMFWDNMLVPSSRVNKSI